MKVTPPCLSSGISLLKDNLLNGKYDKYIDINNDLSNLWNIVEKECNNDQYNLKVVESVRSLMEDKVRLEKERIGR